MQESQFFVVLKDKDGKPQAFLSTQVPFDKENSCFGWQVKLSVITGTVNLREQLNFPSKPRGGWPVVTDGFRRVTPSPDQKSATTEMKLKIKDGWVRNIWCLAEGERLGAYSIEVFLNGKFIKTFNFNVLADL